MNKRAGMTIRRKWVALAVAAACSGNALAAPDDERAKVEMLHETTLSLIQLLVEQGVLKQEAADAMLKKAQQQAIEKAAQARAAGAEADKAVVRVTYVPEHVKREIREQIRQEVVAQAKTERWGDVNAVPEWVERLKWDGDLRVRAQTDLFADGNFTPAQLMAAGLPIDNADEDRERLRVRARLGLTAMVTHNISGGLRLTTGNTGDPVSTNQTLGTSANKYSLVLDRAFIRYRPFDWLSVSGGRLPNPFFSTDLVWDDDVNFEGLAAGIALNTQEPLATVKPFAAFGAFPLQEIESSPTNLAKDKWLFGAQVGTDWVPSQNVRGRFGLAYYDYRNVTGVADTVVDGFNPYADTAPQFRQKGNSLIDISEAGTGTWALASDYKLLNLTASVDLSHFDPLHVILSADVVKNIGYELSDDARPRLGPHYKEKTLGWQTRVTLGWPVMDRPYNWQAFAGYRYLERDAVLDAFTDSDFRLGGTDSKGFFLGGTFAWDRNAWISAKWMSADEIDGLPFGVDVLQVDFNARF